MKNRTLTELMEWKLLTDHFETVKKLHLRDLFKDEKQRAEKFTIYDSDIFFDYSKNLITQETVELLLRLAEKRNLPIEIENMFRGEKINRTENRPVLHSALRNLAGTPVMVDGRNVMSDISKVLAKMRKVSDKIRKKEWQGYSGKVVTNIVNIGIGGSYLGPLMVTEALKYYSQRDLKLFFISNIDGSNISEILNEIDPEETLFIVTSKSFRTQETLFNAHTVKQWLTDYFGSTKVLEKHILAVSANKRAALDFGISENNFFEIWEWIGGRFSLTSAVGLAIMIAIGYENFLELLKGFHSVDNHFRTVPLNKNIPVIMALLGIWYNNFYAAETQAIFPYDHYLRYFPAYVQQGDMESSGKSFDRRGHGLKYQTGPIVWGASGTEAQHSFFQLLHQGTKLVPCDFIGFMETLNNISHHHLVLMSNFFAQTASLAMGKTRAELLKEKTPAEVVPYRICQGNKPSNTILLSKLTPETLGKLIALYEHKIFTQGLIWDIYSFDQWGVELGKSLADDIITELKKAHQETDFYDGSTNSLINFFKKKTDSGK